MYEYTIPQEFNQSDRIGPFNIAQAFILGAGGIIIMLLLSSSMPIWLSILIAIPIFILTVYTMFKKFNGIPIYEFALVYVTYIAMPKLLIYRMDNTREEYFEEVDFIMFEENEMH